MPKNAKRKATAEPNIIIDIERSLDDWKLLKQRMLALKCGEYKLPAKGSKKALAERIHERLHPELYTLNNENNDPNLGCTSSQSGAMPQQSGDSQNSGAPLLLPALFGTHYWLVVSVQKSVHFNLLETVEAKCSI